MIKNLLDYGIERPNKVRIEIPKPEKYNALGKDYIHKYAEMYFIKHFWQELKQKMQLSVLRNHPQLITMLYKMYLESFKLGLINHMAYLDYADEKYKNGE